MKALKEVSYKLGIKKLEKELLREAKKMAKGINKVKKGFKSIIKKKNLLARGRIRFVPR